MEFFGHFRRLTPPQRNTFTACFLGWSLDAFDFFILTFCVSAIATQFQTKVSEVAEAIFITLAFRPVGAFLFGLMADKFGRRPTLMVDIIAYSVFELASAFAPSLKVFLITRALFGIAMGGEWGVGAALAFETLPAEGRGFFSGLLQEGYAVGYLMAALVFGTAFRFVGWRGMFVIGALPAFLVIYIRTRVDESPAWLQGQGSKKPQRRLGKDILTYLGTFVLLVLLMFAFNSFSHGTQDLYPTFLTKGHQFDPKTVMLITVVSKHWRTAGRDFVRNLVGAHRAAKGDCDRRTAGHSGDSVVGVLAYGPHACAGRISDAVYGAGRMGSDSGAFERTFASGGSGDVSWIRLSTGQSAFLPQRGNPGKVGGKPLPWPVSAGSGVDRGDRCHAGSRGHVERTGTQRHRYDEYHCAQLEVSKGRSTWHDSIIVRENTCVVR